MHCVYTAFKDHLTYIGEPEYAKVFEAYRHYKSMSHRRYENYTFTGVLPWLYWQMLFQHNGRSKNIIEMRIQRSYIEIPEYMPEASTVQQEIMFKHTKYWGNWKDEIDLEPAIYCLLNESHAEFMLEKPTFPGARILFAVQLFDAHDRKKESKLDDIGE